MLSRLGVSLVMWMVIGVCVWASCAKRQHGIVTSGLTAFDDDPDPIDDVDPNKNKKRCAVKANGNGEKNNVRACIVDSTDSDAGVPITGTTCSWIKVDSPTLDHHAKATGNHRRFMLEIINLCQAASGVPVFAEVKPGNPALNFVTPRCRGGLHDLGVIKKGENALFGCDTVRLKRRNGGTTFRALLIPRAGPNQEPFDPEIVIKDAEQ